MELAGISVAPGTVVGGLIFYLTQALALIGLTLATVGAAGLLNRRLFDPDLKDYTSFGHIFNLVFFLAVLVLELDLLSPREILSQEVRGARLQGFAILHHGFNAKGVHGPGKSFGLSFAALDDRHGQIIFRHADIDLEHALCPLDGLFGGGMGGVPFLP